MNQLEYLGSHKSFPNLIKLRKGEVLFRQGDHFKGHYLVKSGLIKLIRTHQSGGQSLLSIKNQGEFLGEFVINDTRKTHCDYSVALEDQTLVELIPLEEDGPVRLQKILETVQFELENARIRLERILFQDAEERIKQALKDLALKLGNKYGGETLLKISLTHEDLALLADTSRQTVSTVLSGLKSQNKIRYSRGRILFRTLKNF